MTPSILGLIDRSPLVTATVCALTMRHPWLGTAFLLPVIRRRLAARRQRLRRMAAIPDQQAAAARVMLVGLTAGMSIVNTLEMALAAGGAGPVAKEMGQVLRTSRREGIAAALSGSPGPLTRSLFSRLALASVSGAPMADAVASHLGELRAAKYGRQLERVRRLPVSLLIPLGLLILPGFVVLFVGPIVLGSVGDLLGTLP
ncbi:MAG: type II secretion system F family protein [Actinomycetota bacterium]